LIFSVHPSLFHNPFPYAHDHVYHPTLHTHIRPPSTPTLFPYTTLFRSRGESSLDRDRGGGDRMRTLHQGRLRMSGMISWAQLIIDRKSTRLNSSHQIISYAVFCLKKKKIKRRRIE